MNCDLMRKELEQMQDRMHRTRTECILKATCIRIQTTSVPDIVQPK